MNILRQNENGDTKFKKEFKYRINKFKEERSEKVVYFLC